MEEGSDRIDLQVKGLSLIDFSNENDALILNSSPSPLSASRFSLHNHQSSEKQEEPDTFESLGSFIAGKEAGVTPGSELDDQLPDLNESSEPSRASRKGKCNLRKSLAWDNAFFTSAGVLDPEELSCMIKGAEKIEMQKLPGIQEDMQRSTDSISTLGSEDLTLENFEAELFEDIRASIQKSSKAYNTTNANCKITSGESQAVTSMKKMNLASQNQKPVGISKSQTKQTLRLQSTAKAVKQDSVCSQPAQAVRNGSSNPTLSKPPSVINKTVRNGSSNPTLSKPPSVINQVKPISTSTEKGASLAASQANKLGNTKTTIGTVAGKGVQALKATIISGPCRVLPKSSSSSSSASNSTKIKSATTSTVDSSGNVSSNNLGKSHLEAVRRKIGERTLKPLPSGSVLKTPLKTAKRTCGNSAVSAYLMSSKISPSISPASSISEWSSASSSSSSTINQRSNTSRTSFDANSCRSLDNDTIPLHNDSNNQIIEQHGNEEIVIQNGGPRKSSSQAGTLSHSARPSGLRMPSPKIGFFDGVKSVRTPSGTVQSHASLGALPKVEAAVPSPSRSSNMKPKFGKLSHVRTVSALVRVNPQELSSPMSMREKSLGVSHPTSNVEGSSMSSIKVGDEISGGSCLKVEEVGCEELQEANQVVANAFGEVIMHENCGVPSLQESEISLDRDGVAGSKAHKIFGMSGTRDPNTTDWEGILMPSKKAGEDTRDSEGELLSILPAVSGSDEKENVPLAEHVGK
ncbi:uncharacterized serine-rich protein C215.13-like isoform X1 [Coffea eugenioides]|uniref:uncharacterized serine-rich protein C215.13-like isoform X1 n=1 Tax=Coffea eugenioides TaxID=49369 RepID=UPI000F60897C|nr:uncharacterized serine-rich protein C215.13-like isoform X1 [Coffea eugenioides]